MQQAEQELAACTEAVRKACAMYYNPLASEAKPAAGQSKAKAATLEAPRSVLLSSDGPGAITRPAAIMANAADMEERCANDMAVVRSGAQLQVKQASEVLMTQVGKRLNDLAHPYLPHACPPVCTDCCWDAPLDGTTTALGCLIPAH